MAYSKFFKKKNEEEEENQSELWMGGNEVNGTIFGWIKYRNVKLIKALALMCSCKAV